MGPKRPVIARGNLGSRPARALVGTMNRTTTFRV